MRFNKIFLLTIFAIIGTIFGLQTNAQTGGVTIFPLTFELTVKPGEVSVNTIKVYNPTNNIISIKMEIEDFRPEGETGQVIVEPEIDTTYSLKKWVKIDPAEFTLEPKKEKFVAFTIRVPENAEPGGKYGSILASTTMVAGKEPTGTTIAQKVGSLILLTVSGEVKEILILKEFSISKSAKSVSFKIRLENNGTVHLRPTGSIIIESCQGEKIEDLEIPAINILPGTTRESDVSWAIKGEENCYSAQLFGVYGSASKPFSSDKINFQTLQEAQTAPTASNAPQKLNQKSNRVTPILIFVSILIIMFILFLIFRFLWKF